MKPATPLDEILEADWQKSVIDIARTFGWRVAHFRPAVTSKGWRTAVAADGKGYPDLSLARDRVVFIECKREKGGLADEQRRWVVALLNAYAEVYVVRPRDLQRLGAVLAARSSSGSAEDLSTEAGRLARVELCHALELELGPAESAA